MPEANIVLTTPYNFVPLSDKVVRPSWAPYVSHDIPFREPQSGTFQLTITAKQPIFTRISVSRRETDKNTVKELGKDFNKDNNGRYFIPGSSIKGVIRNVLEIMSFGDLSKGLNEEIWAMRDLTLDSYKNLFSYGTNVYCGWLKKNGEDYVIEDCGIPHRITHQQIDNHFGVKILESWVKNFEQHPPRGQEYKKYNFSIGTADKKYNLFKGRTLQDTFTDIDGNHVKGELVFTGQPSIKFDNYGKGTINVMKGDSKKYKEFIFETKPNPTNRILSKEVVNAFEFAYDKLKMKPGDKKPVFFHKDAKGKGEVTSFGLAYMYKIPFRHSVKEAVLYHQRNSGKGPDLAECIFGHIEKDNALKGRVIFGHAFAVGNPIPMNQKNEVLSSPKATYYPTYVKQKVNADGVVSGSYKTLFDNDTIPSGWKRYPVHQDEVKRNQGSNDNDEIKVKFCPLPLDTQFTCTVNYHNLKKIELGALLSAITFHRTPNCFHTLGMAKPLGYGKSAITVSGIDEGLMRECLCLYEKYMERQLNSHWLNSVELKEFLTMSGDQNNSGRSELVYMKDVKDFANAKRNKQALDLYSKLANIKAHNPTAICGMDAQEPIQDFEYNRNPGILFEQRKTELIESIKRQREELKVREQEIQHEEEIRRAEEKQIEEQKSQEQAANATELSAGINFNGVQERNTVDGLLRTLKRWKESLGGEIDAKIVTKIKGRLSDIFNRLKQKEKQSWIEKMKNDLPRLNAYLNNIDISDIENYINGLS